MRPLASIVINNYNYDRFLGEAIESALGQTYANVEVIVVDDGSTDSSLEILETYSERVLLVRKANGGQASAINAGFAAAQGAVICFLDADDVLRPSAIHCAVESLRRRDAVKAHWPVLEIDVAGNPTGGVRPVDPLPDGDCRAVIVRDGPEVLRYPPTSGNAWSREFLGRVLPLPELEIYRFGGSDAYLSTLAPLFGPICRINEPQTLYRLHGSNNYAALEFERRLDQNLLCYDHLCEALTAFCRALRIEADANGWKERSWLHRFRVAREELEAVIPPGRRFVLVDQEQVGPEIAPGRTVVPLVERNGESWGAPDGDKAAIHELQRQRLAGAEFVAFAWPAFWWFDYYAEFSKYLHSNLPEILRNDRLVVFDLRA
jgi:glycosyltransferase involved in cell wall biosynthesis